MIRHFFAIKDGLATARDGIRIIEADRQRVHV